MKPKPFLIVSLTVLVASICSAQISQARYSSADVAVQNQGTTIAGSVNTSAPMAQTTPVPPGVATTPRPAAQVRPPTGKTYVDRLVNVVGRSNPRARTMVIPKDAADAKTMEQVDEDMVVMAHILEKAVSNEDKVIRAMGIAVSKWPGSSSPQNLFIENHGALFFLDVNFPLLPPPAKEKETATKERTSSEWEVARRELTEPAKLPGRRSSDLYGWEAGSPLFIASQTPAYDAEKVEELKKRVLLSLKNASHIRKLKSDDTVTVVIQGPGAVADKPAKSPGPDSDLDSDGDPFSAGFGAPASMTSTVTATAKLIVRVRKADAEAFENGKMDLDDFRKKAAVMLY